jgi:hypothetical protein
MTCLVENNFDAEDDLVFEDDILTWGIVQRASRAGEKGHITRQQHHHVHVSKSKKKLQAQHTLGMKKM